MTDDALQAHKRGHGTPPPRGQRSLPQSPLPEGRFGRLFRRLKPAPALSDDQLRELAQQMRDSDPPSGGWNTNPTPQGGDNPQIPAGYTYLGQFIDHDLTFDPQSSLERINDPDALRDFRTPRFDLDSLYGSGPKDEPFQYQLDGLHLLVEPNANVIEDLPRNSQGTALIGDPRNDENTIVGQLHLLFAKLHNRFVDQLGTDGNTPADQRLDEAQRLTRWHYQWIVVHDFLPRICGPETFNAVWHTDTRDGTPEIRRRHYRPRNNAYMPVEFSAAAYRYGHSQVRGLYDLNANVTARPIFIPGPLPNEQADLRGFRPLPAGWTIDWSNFFSLDEPAPQPSRLIDTKLVPALFDLPAGAGALPFLNLKRGQALGLPSGQDVAKAIRADHVLTATELGAPEPTPLWFYLLKEAELLAQGQHLGPVGGRIVAEVLLGLLEIDPHSFYNQDPTWQPTLPDLGGDGFTMVDLAAAAATT